MIRDPQYPPGVKTRPQVTHVTFVVQGDSRGWDLFKAEGPNGPFGQTVNIMGVDCLLQHFQVEEVPDYSASEEPA